MIRKKSVNLKIQQNRNTCTLDISTRNHPGIGTTDKQCSFSATFFCKSQVVQVNEAPFSPCLVNTNPIYKRFIKSSWSCLSRYFYFQVLAFLQSTVLYLCTLLIFQHTNAEWEESSKAANISASCRHCWVSADIIVWDYPSTASYCQCPARWPTLVLTMPHFDHSQVLQFIWL